MPYKRNKPEPQPLVPAGVKRTAGYLACDTCLKVIPYFGYDEPGYEPRPEHRCRRREIRPFDRFTTKEPYPSVSMGRWS
jgi:hypothetical protein